MNRRLLQRQKEAAQRRLARAKRTPEQQLAKLDFELGRDVGAVKERAKLLGWIAARRARNAT